MILVKGYGQMCNNILQFAHLYAFGREYGTKVISMRFSYKFRYFAVCKKWYHNPLTYFIGKLLVSAHVIDCITEDNTPAIDRRLRETKLIACSAWGCRYPALFQKYREEIRQLFEIKPTIKEKISIKMAAHPHADISLGLHIRRGDYRYWQGGKYFFDDNVYHKIIKQFCALHTGKTINIYICTNDQKLNIDDFRAIHPTTYLSNGSGIEDLQLLASCDYIIGVKSTFSLWASFYNNVPLYWIMDKDAPLTIGAFTHFNNVYTSV